MSHTGPAVMPHPFTGAAGRCNGRAMRHVFVLSLMRLALVLTIACGLAATGFAHRVTAATDDPAVAAFLAAGGTLADLCGPAADDAATPRTGCPACQLVAIAALPDPAPAATPLRRTAQAAWPCRDGTAGRALHRTFATAPRGPPAGV